ncbi:DUF2281 domain-containing protein [Candidatus Poribacteria bacterium]
MGSIEDKIKLLPPELQREVEAFVESLIESQIRRSEHKLRLNWRGALRDLRDQYTSVELQHKTLKQCCEG